jgi:hypothetical protein
LSHPIVAGRPRDIEDARAIVLKNPSIDRDLIRTELARLQEAVDRPLRKEFDDLDRQNRG